MNKQPLATAISSIFDAQSREAFLKNLPAVLRPRFLASPGRQALFVSQVVSVDSAATVALSKS